MGNENNLNKKLHFKEIFSNKIAFLPIWTRVSSFHYTLVKDSQNNNSWSLYNSKTGETEYLKKISDISKDLKKLFIYIGAEIFSITILVGIFIFGFVGSQMKIAHLIIFLLLTIVSFILLFRLNHKKIYGIMTAFTFFFTLFVIYNDDGFKVLYESIVFYCALSYALFFVIPVLIAKFRYIKANDNNYFFALNDRKGFLFLAYPEDLVSDKEYEKYQKKQKSINNNINDKIKKDDGEYYDEEY